MHQDAHEFLNYLLNRIVEEIEQERKQKGSVPSGDDCKFTADSHYAHIELEFRRLTSGSYSRAQTF